MWLRHNVVICSKPLWQHKRMLMHKLLGSVTSVSWSDSWGFLCMCCTWTVSDSWGSVTVISKWQLGFTACVIVLQFPYWQHKWKLDINNWGSVSVWSHWQLGVSQDVWLCLESPLTMQAQAWHKQLGLSDSLDPVTVVTVSTWMGDRLCASKPSRTVTCHPSQLRLNPSRGSNGRRYVPFLNFQVKTAGFLCTFYCQKLLVVSNRDVGVGAWSTPGGWKFCREFNCPVYSYHASVTNEYILCYVRSDLSWNVREFQWHTKIQAGRRLVRSLTNSIWHLCFHVYVHW